MTDREKWIFNRVCVAIGLINVRCLTSHAGKKSIAGSFVDDETGQLVTISLMVHGARDKNIKKEKQWTVESVLEKGGI